MIALDAIEAALGGVGQDSVVHSGRLDFFGDAIGGGKRLACGFVLNEFEGEEKALAPDFANVGMGGQRGEGGEESFGDWLDGVEESMGLEIVKDSVSSGGADGVGLIRKAVLERAGALGKGIGNSRGDEDSTQRRITTGDAFAG